MNFQKIKEKNLIYQGKFGLEKENLRVDEKGNLAHTSHPFGDDKQVDRDFCENQVEFITKPYDSSQQAWEALLALQKKAENKLLSLPSGKEYLWPFSNPPYVHGEEDIHIAQFVGELKEKTEYRNYLAKKYGKRKMLFSGIHYNFSFDDTLLELIFEDERESDAFQKKKDAFYLNLAETMFSYSWLIVYLMAASPVYDESFEEDGKLGKTVFRRYASPRCSKIGYWNDFVPILNYNGLSEYVDSIQKYVRDGRLHSASELYIPIRLKPRGTNTLERLLEKGIDHIELRMLDLNPLSPAGILQQDLEFIHLLLIYAAFHKEGTFGEVEQKAAVSNMKNAAKFGDSVLIDISKTTKMKINHAAMSILKDMKSFFEKIGIDESGLQMIDYQIEKVNNPKKRYAQMILELFGEQYVEKGMALAQAYAEQE